MSSEPTTVKFHYIKSNLFRIVHVDGAIGGSTPAGLIFVSLYSERAPIPTLLVHQITEAGQIGPEQGREGREGIVREVEIGAMLSLETAVSLSKWLQDQIELAKKLRATAEKEKTRGTDAPIQ